MTQTKTDTPTTTLYYREGRSDKVYQVSIEEAPGGFVVTFAYGRRGSTLKTGVKTREPVPVAEAVGIHDKLVASKIAKGYTPGPDGTPYHGTAAGSKDTGVRCQLANPISKTEAEALLRDDSVVMQEKFDGRRMLVRKTATGDITGINRRGFAVALPGAIAMDAARLPDSFLIDGEAVGDTLHAFDLLRRNRVERRGRSLADRVAELDDLFDGMGCNAIRSVPTARTREEKTAMLTELRRRKAEGAVFKHMHSPYRAGRPASGGDWLKFKFVETASFIVGRVNPDRRSVALELLDEAGIRVPAGNVAIPPNHPVPKPGEAIEVRYLHAFFESGVIYQPVYLGPRDDIPPEDCTFDQLKFKPQAKNQPT